MLDTYTRTRQGNNVRLAIHLSCICLNAWFKINKMCIKTEYVNTKSHYIYTL